MSLYEKSTWEHIILLTAIALIIKIASMVVSLQSPYPTLVIISDYTLYYQNGLLLFGGTIPYFVNTLNYPPLLFIPVMIAMVPAVAFDTPSLFAQAFRILMMGCDLLVLFYVYSIVLKIWNDKRRAFIAGLIYVLAISTQYFVVTRYDIFPTLLLMMAITYTIYDDKTKGYITAILGYLAKLFPIIALPFFILYNSKGKPLKQELISAGKIALPVFVTILLLAGFITNFGSAFLPITAEWTYNSTTFMFTLYSWLHNVLGFGVSIDMVSWALSILTGAVLLPLLYILYKSPEKNPALLIKCILCAIIITIVSAKVTSPQYIVWFTPLICILADDVKKIAAFFLVQVFTFIEFPMVFGLLYTTKEYLNPALSTDWWITLGLFTAKYLALSICIWLVVNPREILGGGNNLPNTSNY
jgi:hypothetical protein